MSDITHFSVARWADTQLPRAHRGIPPTPYGAPHLSKIRLSKILFSEVRFTEVCFSELQNSGFVSAK